MAGVHCRVTDKKKIERLTLMVETTYWTAMRSLTHAVHLCLIMRRYPQWEFVDSFSVNVLAGVLRHIWPLDPTISMGFHLECFCRTHFLTRLCPELLTHSLS